jgi:hypothetical protein
MINRFSRTPRYTPMACRISFLASSHRPRSALPVHDLLVVHLYVHVQTLVAELRAFVWCVGRGGPKRSLDHMVHSVLES